jgi:hypothetical protein
LKSSSARGNVSLCAHSDQDKAIDISLNFFGTEQESPRLTLSEGYRNSLGLCIFLSLAKSDPNGDPIVLDDIVSSLDSARARSSGKREGDWKSIFDRESPFPRDAGCAHAFARLPSMKLLPTGR